MERRPAMENSGFRRLIADLLLAVAAVTIFGVAARAHADDSCLVSVHGESDDTISNGGSVCQAASGNSCTFMLTACVNHTVSGCAPGQSKKKKIHAKGRHCGGIGRLNVAASSAEGCGTPAAIKVSTKKHGTKA